MHAPHVVLDFEVFVETVGTILTASSAVLVAAEWAGDMHAVRQVDPDGSGVQFLGDLISGFKVFGENVGTKAKVGVVGHLDCLIKVFVGDDAHDGTKDFFAADRQIVGGNSKNRGAVERA